MTTFAMFVNWSNLYLICFLVGLILSVFSLLMGAFHLHWPGHVGHMLHHGHVHLGHGHVHAGAPAAGGGRLGAEISPINFSTLMAFLTWFGGVGYLMTRVYHVWAVLALGVATVAGLAGGGIVFWYLVKVMMAHDHTMDPADFRVVGVVGKVTNPIRAGGTGEIVYVQGGTRKTAAARAENGATIAKGSEVAVTRYEKGIAYVRLWEELAEPLAPAGEAHGDEHEQ